MGEGTFTVMEVLRASEQWLAARGAEAPRRSAELLLGKVLGLPRLQLYLAHDRPLDAAERLAMRTLLQRRGKGEPVAHLLGSWSFRGLELEVSRDVLVPRPETEELVDLVLARCPQGGRLVDLGTGSGAIAIACAVARPDLAVVATDVSEPALAIAQRNAARHGVAGRIRLARGSWWDAVPAEAPFDVVASNPPYVDPGRMDLVAPDVAAYEPALALYAPAGDVAACYRSVGAGLERALRPGGHVVFETGAGCFEQALDVVRGVPCLEQVQVLQDLGQQPRFVVGRRRS
ncbi:MAG: hypothetical protein RL148_2330 [Planctomycetota bacterium]|jgi:release factor glutamine methyltransferase